MNIVSKFAIGAAASALAVTSIATPAQARHRSGGGIDAGDVITGVAIIGGIAAIAAALDRDGRSYGYGYRTRYRGDYTTAVNACAYEADRYSRGRVRITDVDRRGGYRYRVRGVIEKGGYNRYYGFGYDRYSHRAARAFTCTARGDGRVTNFRLNRSYY